MASWFPSCSHPLFYPSYPSRAETPSVYHSYPGNDASNTNYYNTVPSYYPPSPAVYQTSDWSSSPYQLPCLPDVTPLRQPARQSSHKEEGNKVNSRRSLFDGGDLGKVSNARDFLDSLLGIPDCPEDDSILCGGGRPDLVPVTPSPAPVIPEPAQPWHSVPLPDIDYSLTRPSSKRPHPSADEEPREKRQRVGHSVPAWTVPCPLPPAPTPQPSSQYKCEDCGKTYRHRSSLRAHRRVHKGQTYTCDTCGRNFAHRSTLTKHERTHSNLRPFVCTICSATFTQSGNLYRHVRNVHEDIALH